MKSTLRLKKEQFQLDTKFTNLNHGPYGACLHPIFIERAKWQKEIENLPLSSVKEKAINEIE